MIAPQPSSEIPSGTTLGKYDILHRIATGGMAEIYLARGRGQAGFEKLVVLKRILPQVAADPVFVRMFLEEAKLAATLRHPHIADVWEVDCVDGMYFFTMEYIHGQDVRAIRAASRKRNERMPLAIAVGIVSAVASALEYAHERTGPDGASLHLVHRDISASNILVSYDGAIKLLDFGIAHAADRSENTRTGSIKGKVPYMSPEQCMGRKLDCRSDLFSLGTVLYELSVGRRPYRGDNDFVIMEQIVRVDPTPPTQLDAAYPPELERIVLKLLARELEARYRTADELISDLERFQTTAGLWVSAKVVSRFMRSLFWDNIEAWERAARDGTLEQHITAINVDERRPEAVTPPSAFPIATSSDSVAPFASMTQEPVLPFGSLPNTTGPQAMIAGRPPLVRPSVPVFAPPSGRPATDPVTTVSPASSMAPEPPRRRLVIALAAAGLLIGVTAGYLVMSALRDKDAVVTREPSMPRVTAPATKPEPVATEPPKPPKPPEPTTPEPEPPKPEPPKPEPVIEMTPDLATSEREQKVVPRKPKPDQNSPTEKKTIKLKPEETKWDPNSPVLPPRR